MSEQNISHILPAYWHMALSKNWKPLHIVDAEGVYFFDAAGKKYLIFIQLMCSHLGTK
jgi:4-aminobutyrate aminotransferase-like enzyme